MTQEKIQVVAWLRGLYLVVIIPEFIRNSNIFRNVEDIKPDNLFWLMLSDTRVYRKILYGPVQAGDAVAADSFTLLLIFNSLSLLCSTIACSFLLSRIGCVCLLKAPKVTKMLIPETIAQTLRFSLKASEYACLNASS